MSTLLCNVLKISGGANAPNASRGYVPVEYYCAHGVKSEVSLDTRAQSSQALPLVTPLHIVSTKFAKTLV